MTNLKIADFKDFVMLAGDKIVTDSRRVAKHFGKRHDNVLRAIKKMGCSELFAKLNFEVCFENNELQNGKPLKFYRMTKDGFLLLVMGFTGRAAMTVKEAYIAAFNAMAEHIKLQATSVWREYQAAVVDYKKGEAMASIFGRGLRQWGVIKPVKAARLTALESRMQMPLLLE